MLQIVLAFVPPFPPESTHALFVPILYVILSAAVILGGFAVALWRFFVWLRDRISEGVQVSIGGFSAALIAHEQSERGWQDRIEKGQQALRDEFQEARVFLSDRVEAIHVRIDRLMDGGR